MVAYAVFFSVIPNFVIPAPGRSTAVLADTQELWEARRTAKRARDTFITRPAGPARPGRPGRLVRRTRSRCAQARGPETGAAGTSSREASPEAPPADARPDRARRLVDARWGRALVASVVVLALGTVVGLIALWPTGQHHGPGHAFGGETSGATVVAVREAQCPGPTPQRCRVLGARIDDGPKSGLVTTLELGPTNLVSSLSRGDSIRVHPVAAPPGSRDVAPFQFAGVDRRGTLRWLVILFAALVVILTRWRGVLALGGFALGLFLVVKFLVPAILARLLRCSSLWSARQRSCS